VAVVAEVDEVVRGRCIGDAAVEGDSSALVVLRERLVQAVVVVCLEESF